MNGGAIPDTSSASFGPMVYPNTDKALGPSTSNCPGDLVNELDVPNAIEIIFKTPF